MFGDMEQHTADAGSCQHEHLAWFMCTDVGYCHVPDAVAFRLYRTNLRGPYVTPGPSCFSCHESLHRYPQDSPTKHPRILGIIPLISLETGSDLMDAGFPACAQFRPKRSYV